MIFIAELIFQQSEREFYIIAEHIGTIWVFGLKTKQHPKRYTMGRGNPARRIFSGPAPIIQLLLHEKKHCYCVVIRSPDSFSEWGSILFPYDPGVPGGSILEGHLQNIDSGSQTREVGSDHPARRFPTGHSHVA